MSRMINVVSEILSAKTREIERGNVEVCDR